jgi:HNH endonuclease
MAPSIPPRFSSLAVLQEARVRNKESQQDLKRKLSDETLVEGSAKRIGLQMERVELEKEDQELQRAWWDMEMSGGRVDQKTYRKAQKNTSSRIVSLGEELWRFTRQLRTHEEQAGNIELLTPDSDNAFAAALLRLYKDPLRGEGEKNKNRDTTLQSNMRQDAIKAYRSLGADAEKELGVPKDGLRCTILGEYMSKEVVVAAHIVPAHLGVELADYIFGPGSGTRLFSIDNCLILISVIEKAFDKGSLAIVPVDASEKPIRRWKTVLLNEAVRNQRILGPSEGDYGDLDGKEIEFYSDHRPAARFLYYHFVVSLLRCRRARMPGWETVWAKLRTGRPWSTPGRYLRQSMLLALARAAGDVNEEEIAGLIDDRVFVVPERLALNEEEEVARRVMEMHDQKKKIYQDEEEEEDDDDNGDDEDDDSDDE